MTSVNSVGATQYSGYPQTAYTPGAQYPTATPGYTTDGYQASPYATGYSQGVNAVGGTAMGISGMANGVSSMANSLGGIFGTIFDVIANILNTIVNIVVNIVKGVLGIFGIGKDKGKEGQMPGGPGAVGGPQPVQTPNGPGVMTPAGTPVPPPPPHTDVKTAYDIVAGDVQNIQDPNQAVQVINIHALKAKDYREKVEQFTKEAEKEARQASYLAESIQSKGFDQSKLAELNQHKSKAIELMKTAEEYTKAVYDEALYAQAARDILSGKFGNAISEASKNVDEAWKNWVGGTTERKWIFFKEEKKPAPEVFMNALNAVNANIGRATQILNTLSPAAAGAR